MEFSSLFFIYVSLPLTAAIYFLIVMGLSKAVGLLERRLRSNER